MSTSQSSLDFIRSLPPVPHVDVTRIKGNMPDEQKQLGVNTLAHFISTPGKSYGADVGQRIRVVEMNLFKREDGPLESQIICEIEVTEDMCNVYGTLHGGCAAYIMDPCSSSAIVSLGIATGIDGIGMSQAMNIIWHHAVKKGSKLRVVSTSISITGRVRSARCELWNTADGTLCVSAVHSTINPRAKFSSDGKL